MYKCTLRKWLSKVKRIQSSSDAASLSFKGSPRLPSTGPVTQTININKARYKKKNGEEIRQRRTSSSAFSMCTRKYCTLVYTHCSRSRLVQPIARGEKVSCRPVQCIMPMMMMIRVLCVYDERTSRSYAGTATAPTTTTLLHHVCTT